MSLNSAPSPFVRIKGTAGISSSFVTCSSIVANIVPSLSRSFTKTMHGRPAARMSDQRRCSSLRTPVAAFTTSTTPSATRNADRTSAMKLGDPGVSRRLSTVSWHRQRTTPVWTDVRCWISSGSKSETVVPAWIEPGEERLPAQQANASTNEVLPDPAFDTTATFLMDSARGTFIMTSSGSRRPLGAWLEKDLRATPSFLDLCRLLLR